VRRIEIHRKDKKKRVDIEEVRKRGCNNVRRIEIDRKDKGKRCDMEAEV
jgi:hypothetical protein